MRSPLATATTWPTEARERYRALGYWTDETLADFVSARTSRFADRLAVVGQDAHGIETRWTYADLGAESVRAAARLSAHGVQPGDRVIIALPNIVEYLAVVLGAFRLGALPIFALPTHREVELTQFCTIAEPAAWVGCSTDLDLTGLHCAVSDRLGGSANADAVEPPVLIDVADWGTADWGTAPADLPLPAAPTSAEQIAFLQLSGGTTGVSKLIPRTSADYLYSVRESARICDLDPSTVMLVVLPASHNFTMSSPGILGVLHTGGTLVLAREPSPRTSFGLVARERVTTVALVPPLAQAWISAARRRPPDLSSLRTVQIGGARLNETTARDVGPVLGAQLQQVFGMAEGLVCYTRADDPDELVLTTQGTPISRDDEIRIVDQHDQEVEEGDEGALLTRGPYTIRGYYRAGPLEGAPCTDTAFTEDGFYRTGDLVRRLPTGHLIVTGREKDQINRAGEKIAVDEIEGHLLSHRDVLDAVAVGLPDDYLGEKVCAVIRTEADRPRPEPDELADHLRAAGLATYKIPDTFAFLDAFPTTHVGKNSRRELRTLLAAHLLTPTLSSPQKSTQTSTL